MVETTKADPASDYADSALRAAGLRGELIVSVVRALFCALIIVRFLLIHTWDSVPNALWRGVLVLPPTLLVCGFSCVVIWSVRRGRAGLGVLSSSVLLDATVCVLALGSNVLWPWPAYRGILELPDTLALVAMIVAAGFRVSSRLATLGAVANCCGLGALIALDFALNAEQIAYGGHEVSFYAVLFSCMGALCIAGARRTELLVVDAAHHAAKTRHARRGLDVLLREHHDAAGLLSAALFGARRLRPENDATAAQLQADLELLRAQVEEIREQALNGVTTLDDVVAVDVRAALESHREMLERVSAPMAVSWDFGAGDTSAWVTGGSRALCRAVLNLLVNAREGDGRSGATHAVLRVDAVGEELRLSVSDNGPGLLATDQSSKAFGSGAGLRFIRELAAASEGRFELAGAGEGALATLIFRRALANRRRRAGARSGQRALARLDEALV